MRTVLITGARAPAAIDLARDFHAAGFEVHMADSFPSIAARSSRAVAGFTRLPSPRHDTHGFRLAVSALVSRIGPDLVVPTCEEIFHLAAARRDGTHVGRLFSPPFETLALLHDKGRFADHARGLKLDVPETRRISSVGEIEGMDLPDTVLKPCHSRFGSDALVSPDPATAAAIDVSPSRPWVAQRRVRGVEHCSYAVARAGRVVASASYRGSRRMGGGASYAVVPSEPEVAARMRIAAETIAADLSIDGQIAFDAIDDGERAMLLECNPRSTTGVHLLAGRGGLARAIADGVPMEDPTPGGRHNLPMMLTHGLVDAAGGRGVRAWISDLQGARDMIGSPGDRLPMLGAVVDAGVFAWRGIMGGTGIVGATTDDIEWNGR